MLFPLQMIFLHVNKMQPTYKHKFLAAPKINLTFWGSPRVGWLIGGACRLDRHSNWIVYWFVFIFCTKSTSVPQIPCSLLAKIKSYIYVTWSLFYFFMVAAWQAVKFQDFFYHMKWKGRCDLSLEVIPETTGGDSGRHWMWRLVGNLYDIGQASTFNAAI